MPNHLPHEVEKVVLALCEDLATPISLGVYLRVKYGCWDELAIMSVDPKHYTSSVRYWADAQAVSLLRKLEDLPTSIDRKAVAVENFWKSERECFRTNQRLLPFIYHSWSDEMGAIAAFLRNVRKNVKRLLGRCPDLQDGRFGPGATFGDRGRFTTVPDKMSSRPTITPDAVWFMFPWTGTAWAKACAASERDPVFIRGNRFTTVPKDCTKDRGICIEPSINLFFQLAYGGYMKGRLDKMGFHPHDAQDIHKQVAREASIKGHLATIDLSNASDTVSRNLVKLLLPDDWYSVLSDLRSSRTLIEGKWVLLEKFSSMGNGFTFELETTIFAAICMTVMEHHDIYPIPGENVFVFGDDIIVPTEVSRDVIWALRFLGFTPNANKTFVDGPFRESCGGDYFNGMDVRPYFLKELPSEPQQYIAMANGLRRVGCSDGLSSYRRSLIRRAWFCILDALPSDVRRLRGPEDLGDLVIHDDEERWQTRWRSSIRYIRCYRPARYRVISWSHWTPDVVLAAALYGVPSGVPHGIRSDVNRRRLPRGGVIPRDGVAGYKVGWVPRS